MNLLQLFLVLVFFFFLRSYFKMCANLYKRCWTKQVSLNCIKSITVDQTKYRIKSNYIVLTLNLKENLYTYGI